MPEQQLRSIPRHAVDRPSLRAQLDAGLASPLSLVVAPAGAGKTVLLSQWAKAQKDRTVVWIDVSDTDADVFAFSRRLVGALALAPGFHPPSAPVDASQNRLGEALVEDLAAGLRDAGPITVIFDDLDRLTGCPLVTDLWRLVDQLPPNAHFVFSSRMDLKLGWSRHRLEHNLVEIRQRELAFDDATTAQVLENITGRPVAGDTAAAVTARTEGWAVGVQLTALSLRFSSDPARTVDALAETDRLIVDYLGEEVLDAQDPARRDAIMRIAVVDRFSAPLIDAMLGGGGAQMIDDLERDSMFVYPVLGEPGWYRFHRLFRNLLLLRLHAEDAAAEAAVLRAAAAWCESEGLADSAIDYHLRARDWEAAVAGVLALGREVYERLRIATVAGWLEKVPVEVRERRPDAEILLAMAQGMSGNGIAGSDAMRAVLAEGDLDAGQRQVALAYLAACVQLVPSPEFFVETARRALDLLSAEPHAELPHLLGLTSRPLLELVARASLGRALLLAGDLDDARSALRTALEGEGIAYRPYRVHALGSLALVEAFSGRLHVAAELANDALGVATEFGLLTHPAPADAYLARAVAAVRRGESDIGALSLMEGRVRAASNQRTQLLWLAHLAAHLIDAPEALTTAPETAGPPPPFVRQAMVALAHRKARYRGAPAAPVAPVTSWSIIAFEEIAGLLTTGQPAQALTRLGEFEPPPEGAPMVAIERDLLSGWAYALEGRRTQSRAHLQAALDLAAPEGLLYPFLEAGPVIAPLLDDLPGPGDEFRHIVVRRTRGVGGVPRQQRLAEKLTQRELELLAYLPTRMTFADIAAHSFVSINTIKTHIGHIYRKLGVTGRDEAIERAADLGLIDTGQVARMG